MIRRLGLDLLHYPSCAYCTLRYHPFP
uniref:Uncharacterized protein n=1 Tax=Anguilla anguilla TaxID=7936 RepID=A0A0E9TJE4_ANGAN